MTELKADLHFVPTDEGGRLSSVASGYRPQFYFDGQDYDCTVTLPDNERVNPGDWAFAIIALSKYASGLLYCRIAPGCAFQLREGAKVVAIGTVTSVLQ